MLQEFEGAARMIGLDEGLWKILTNPKRQIIVSCPVLMDSGKIEAFTGYRVQYHITLGPAKGGIRYHPGVNSEGKGCRVDDEVRRAGVPFGGGKGGVVCDPSKMSKRARSLTRRYIAEIIDAIGPEKDVPAPDVNTNEQVMAWVMDTYSMHVGVATTAVVTGKPIEMAGRSDGGGDRARRDDHDTRSRQPSRLDIKNASVAVQASATGPLRPCSRARAKIVAVTDWYGGSTTRRGSM
jgi:glutamate dehydrogenase (NAD(P)+)